MIITQEVDIVLTSQSVTYYENKGYHIPRYFDKRYNKWKFKRGSKITVKVKDLSPCSPVIVLCSCDVCGKHRYLRKDSSHKLCNVCGNSSSTRKQLISQKLKNKPKSKSHIINIRKSMIKLGFWKSPEERTSFKNYKLKVTLETKRHIKNLFKNWNGLDYYTGEKLLTEIKMSNDKMYRTIDHKISIKYGFINKIDPKEIGNLENLCICSRSTNSKKKDKDYETFKSHSLSLNN